MKTFDETEYKGKDFDQIPIPSILILFASLFLISCGSSDKGNDHTLSNTIEEVQIGNQAWMAKNYDGITFWNGDSIPHA